MAEQILIQKSVDMLMYDANGKGRRTMQFTEDEILFLKNDQGETKWQLLHDEINKYRARHGAMSFGYFMTQVKKLGLKKKKKEVRIPVKKKEKPGSEFYDPSEYKKYYNF